LSCSALKVAYLNILREAGNIKFLFLKVSEKEVSNRLEHREGHFMPSSSLHSQMETLDIPQYENDVIIIDAFKESEKVLEDCILKLH
jgi:gluconokinase